MFTTFFGILFIGLTYLIGAATTYLYLSTRNKKKKNNLQILNNDVMIKKASSNIVHDDQLRTNVIEQLSRQKLIFSKEDNCWIRLKQIN